jgi:hypothetical protein
MIAIWYLINKFSFDFIRDIAPFDVQIMFYISGIAIFLGIDHFLLKKVFTKEIIIFKEKKQG